MFQLLCSSRRLSRQLCAYVYGGVAVVVVMMMVMMDRDLRGERTGLLEICGGKGGIGYWGDEKMEEEEEVVVNVVVVEEDEQK